eukprot:COSAG01_NODE_71021_length_257_cov_0.645570_1_plen_20_part_01
MSNIPYRSTYYLGTYVLYGM